MKTSSAKAKGQRLQKQVVEDIRRLLNVDTKETSSFEGIVQANPMGNSGVDVKIAGDFQEKFPFSIECKNVEKWSIPQWWKQAEANVKEGTNPMLIISKNRHKTLVILEWDVFLRNF